MTIKNSRRMDRRDLFRRGIAIGGLAAGTVSFGQVCGLPTGAQGQGPFFPHEGTPVIPVKENQDPNLPIALSNDNDLTFVQGVEGQADGQVVYLTGRVLNENCQPIPDATIILWQASSTGAYNHNRDSANRSFRHPVTGEQMERKIDPSFQYWGRALTDAAGGYLFKTIIPGFYPADVNGGWYRPPHLHIMVSAMGYPQFVTQMYFRGEDIVDNDWIQQLNTEDLLLQTPSITDEQREGLIVDFVSGDGNFEDGLLGSFELVLAR